MNDLQLNKKIKELSKNKNIPIKILCEKIGITQNGFSKALKNNTLRVDTLCKISEIFEVDISFFYSDEHDKKMAIIDREFKRMDKDISILKHRCTFIVYSLLEQLIEKEKILELMNLPIINDCFIKSFIKELNNNNEVLTSKNKEFYLNFINDELIKPIKESNNNKVN